MKANWVVVEIVDDRVINYLDYFDRTEDEQSTLPLN